MTFINILPLILFLQSPIQAVEHEGDGDTNYSWLTRNRP